MPFLRFLHLKKFCYCIKLVTGVRVITGMALVIGDIFIFMGASLYADYEPSLILASAVSYYISGAFFCLWFLFLLLFQSLTSKIPRVVVMLHTKFQMAWLLLMILALMLTLLILSHHKYEDYGKEKNFITAGIAFSSFALVMTCYSFVILRSYISTLASEERPRSSRFTFVSSLSEELEDFVSDLPKLASQSPFYQKHIIKTLRNDTKMLRPSITSAGVMNTRPSQISILSGSQLSTLSMLSKTKSQEVSNVLPTEYTANMKNEYSQESLGNSKDNKSLK